MPETRHFTPQDVPAAIEALGAEDPEDRIHARMTLIGHGEEALEPLLHAVESPDPVGREALEALAALGSPGALGPLHARLCDPRAEVRWIAAEGLSRLGLDAIERVLHDLTDSALPEPTRRAIHHVLAAQRGRALRTLLKPVLDAFRHDIAHLEVARCAHEVADALRQSR